MNYTITYTELQNKAMQYAAADVSEWLSILAEDRANRAIDEIVKELALKIVFKRVNMTNYQENTAFSYLIQLNRRPEMRMVRALHRGVAEPWQPSIPRYVICYEITVTDSPFQKKEKK